MQTYPQIDDNFREINTQIEREGETDNRCGYYVSTHGYVGRQARRMHAHHRLPVQCTVSILRLAVISFG